ncbi:hypothetical protein MRB53_013726 [Persea americana]|uniref:Uncharacterized protein n=1 Tax=Persea americana TaxID=3435 RepID=A0ACC2K8X2_PERAE|nr:hypothetical protein MRB53_013726 [Persea americana]
MALRKGQEFSLPTDIPLDMMVAARLRPKHRDEYALDFGQNLFQSPNPSSSSLDKHVAPEMDVSIKAPLIQTHELTSLDLALGVAIDTVQKATTNPFLQSSLDNRSSSAHMQSRDTKLQKASSSSENVSCEDGPPIS